MSSSSSLDSIFYIKVPENFVASDDAFKIDTSIELPVQKKMDDLMGEFDASEISTEQILAGILTVLAYDRNNAHLDYYRSILLKVKPNIKKELCEAAILKTKNEDFDLAEEIFLALLGLDPEDSALMLNMALFLDQRADSYRNNGLLEDADAYDNDANYYYEQALNADPVIPDSYFNVGFFYMKQHKYIEARDAFESYIALTCDVPDDELGDDGIYKKERAQGIVNKIKASNMDDEAFRAAYDYISRGEEEKGLEEIRLFLQHNPKVWNAWFLLGWGLRRLNRFDDAKGAFLEALKNGGDENADTYNELSLCYVQEKDFTEAKNCLIKALSIEPESTKVISNLGYLSLAMGNKAEARKYFAAVLEIEPNDKIAASELMKLEAE
jgi:tetratricopeptide (TPR) repeat protein